MPNKLPPFESLLKSREVEDPINVHVHRRLAYAFVWVFFKTPLTPNGITFMALTVGVFAGALLFWGTPEAMLVGGILLWSSAILDGADGILARAKNLQSQFGRALDGAADGVVALASVIGAFAHLWSKHEDPMFLILGMPTLFLTLVHLCLYEYYKDFYLQMTRKDQRRDGAEYDKVKEDLASLDQKRWITRLAVTQVLLPYLLHQKRLIMLTNPKAWRGNLDFEVSDASIETYRKYNRGPMRIWAFISLAPHYYLISICAMVDRIDIYFWIRLVGMNVLFVIVLIWQHSATKKTLIEFEKSGVIRNLPGPVSA